jgi:hypothetical protein
VSPAGGVDSCEHAAMTSASSGTARSMLVVLRFID